MGYFKRLLNRAAALPRSAVGIPAVLMLSVLIIWVANHTLRRYIKCVPKPCCGSVPELEDSDVTGDKSQRSSAAADMSLRTYVIQRLAITWLVLFFDSYDKTAQTALGMLFCVNVGAGPHPKRWVMDVRLPCTTAATYNNMELLGWQRAAIAVGILLFLAYICFPMLLAGWLVTQAVKGIITSQGSTEAPASSDSSISRVLQFRYADYNVQYGLLSKPTANRVMSSGPEPTGWRSSVVNFWRHLSFHQMQLWAVLCWDSILDLHRLLLALAALAVMLHELHQLLLVVLVLSSYFVLILAARPYKCTTIWRLQVSALWVLLLSCFGIIACNIGGTTGFYQDTTASKYRNAVPWVVIALNAGYLLSAGCVLVRSVWHKCRREGCAVVMCVPRCSTAAPGAAASC
jgi:hypothetical protein